MAYIGRTPTGSILTGADIADGSISTAKLDQNEGFTFNENSASVDFRVESNGNSNMIKVDGSNDRVGIGTSSPSQALHVEGNLLVDAYNNAGEGGGIFLRQGFETTAQPSITLKDHSGSAPDGISVNGSDGVSFRTADTERMRIDASGNLAVGTTGHIDDRRISLLYSRATHGGMLIKNGDSASEAFHMTFQNTNGTVGSITVSGTSTAYNTSSDYRLKENVDYTFDATSRLKQLKPARFNFKTDADTTVDGFLAHEVSSIVPEAISGEKDGVDEEGNPRYQGIDQSKLVPLLVKTIQELEARITELENA